MDALFGKGAHGWSLFWTGAKKKIDETDGAVEMKRRFLFYGGIFGPVAYLLVDIIGGIITPGYSYVVNAVSELIQTGSEHTLLLSPLMSISAIMGVLFGVGIVSNFRYRQSKLLFIGGTLIIISGIMTSLTASIFPQDPIGADVTFRGTMHLVLVGISAVLTIPGMLTIGIGLYREKKWKLFRLYSIIAVVIMTIFGGLSPLLIMSDIELAGLFERIVVYGYWAWVFVLATLFIKEQPSE